MVDHEHSMLDEKASHEHTTSISKQAERLKHNLLQEDCMSLPEAARKLPPLRGDKPPHRTTLVRWSTDGRRSRTGKRVHLRIWLVGGTNLTSTQALLEFFVQLNDVKPTDNTVEANRTLFEKKQPTVTSLEKKAKQALEILRRRGRIK